MCLLTINKLINLRVMQHTLQQRRSCNMCHITNWYYFSIIIKLFSNDYPIKEKDMCVCVYFSVQNKKQEIFWYFDEYRKFVSLTEYSWIVCNILSVLWTFAYKQENVYLRLLRDGNTKYSSEFQFNIIF